MGALIKDEEQPAEGPLPKYDPPKKVQITFPENTVKLFLIYYFDSLPKVLKPSSRFTIFCGLSMINIYQILLFKCGEEAGPAVLQCKACDSSVWSTVTSSTTTLGWVWFSLCCFCCLGCACLPFCTKDFKVHA